MTKAEAMRALAIGNIDTAYKEMLDTIADMARTFTFKYVTYIHDTNMVKKLADKFRKDGFTVDVDVMPLTKNNKISVYW